MLDKPQTPAHFPTPAWAPDRWRLIERDLLTRPM